MLEHYGGAAKKCVLCVCIVLILILKHLKKTRLRNTIKKEEDEKNMSIYDEYGKVIYKHLLKKFKKNNKNMILKSRQLAKEPDIPYSSRVIGRVLKYHMPKNSVKIHHEPPKSNYPITFITKFKVV
jgi:hypothetical protein